MFLSISVSKKTMFTRMIMLFIGCCTMHANDALSLLSQPNNSSWGSKLRHSLSSSLSSAWEKSYERFDALPTSYKYAVGGGAGLLLAGGAFLGYKKFAAQKQHPLQNNPVTVANYIAQHMDDYQQDFPTEDSFAQFQHASDIGPTQVLQAVCRQSWLGYKQRLHHWSALVKSGANPFAPSIVEGEVNAFVLLMNMFEMPSLVLPIVQLGRGSDTHYSEDEPLFTFDEIKAGIKATLVQLLAKDGLDEEFNKLVKFIKKSRQCVFTASDWEDVLVMAAGTDIVNEEGYIRILRIAAEMNVQIPSSSSSSIKGDSQSSSADFVSKPAVASAPFYTIDIEVEGIKCCVRSHHNNDGSVWYYAVAFGSDSSNISIISPFHYYFNSEGFSGYIAQELRDKFGIDATEDGVKALLIRSNVPGFVVNNEAGPSESQATLQGSAMSLDEVWPDID